MCVFYRQTPTIEKGLLQKAEDFTFPIGEEFPGDVMIGWRKWVIDSQGDLRSPTFRSRWIPGRPIAANGPPSTRTGRGIYCLGSEQAVVSRLPKFSQEAWGSVALWGVVLNFTASPFTKKKGCMGQFGYPLEIHLPGWMTEPLARRFAERWTPSGTEVFWNANWESEQQL